MRFLVDMNVSPRVARWLREHGHDAVHLSDQHLGRLEDIPVFRKAMDEDRVVVTFDLEFGEIVALSGAERAGVMLLRLRSTRTEAVIGRLKPVSESDSDT